LGPTGVLAVLALVRTGALVTALPVTLPLSIGLALGLACTGALTLALALSGARTAGRLGRRPLLSALQLAHRIRQPLQFFGRWKSRIVKRVGSRKDLRCQLLIRR